ncbi:glutathione S-transferase family protein [Aerosakkonemataceae cyanobacterium BLCC-F50]|uniref:Glutathione S-transferase family protein n=1 Tax=Floridaenema flaviceps BLCC-F50 TaxID=3153642 RepID=A0ABV4Y5X7_9CYAN
MMKLYHTELSGNCHKVRLMLSLLEIKHERVLVDLAGGEHKSADFLELNPLGQVPVLMDGDTLIRDSQAILVYLTRKYEREDWLPLEAESMAKVMQWLSFAANEINTSLFIARLHFRFGMDFDWERAQQKGKQVLQIIDDHLQGRNWLEQDRATIADIACYPYVGLAPEGKVALEPYPNIIAWIDRIKQLPSYEAMPGL